MKKKAIDPKDLEVNREFLTEKSNAGVYADVSAEFDEETVCVTNFTCNQTNVTCNQTKHCSPSEEDDAATLCVSKTYCEPTEKNCPATQGNAGNCQPITKQEGCVNTKNNCLSKYLCGDSNDICLVSRNICPPTGNNCQESVDKCQQTKNNCHTFNNCANTETCAIPATRLPARCIKE